MDYLDGNTGRFPLKVADASIGERRGCDQSQKAFRRYLLLDFVQ